MKFVIIGYIILFNAGIFEPKTTHINPPSHVFSSMEECEVNRLYNYKMATLGDIKKISLDATTCVKLR